MTSSLLRIRLFGELDLRLGEVSLPPLGSARAESLLAYLLLHRAAPQPRHHLAFLLWPDSTEAQARTNLRHVLHSLRRALPDSDRYLAVTPRTLQWREDAPCWLDVAAFDEALTRSEQETGQAELDTLAEAVALYAGDLLQGSYDEWLLGERERLQQRYITALTRLTALLEARRDHGQAIHVAERLLRHDPLDEGTYRQLMRLHDARGSRARALRVYHLCAATLERELGIEPSTATCEAYEALLPDEREPDADDDGRIGGPPLVGRAAEWSRLTTLWRGAENGRARLVLVTGEPGIGKTRLVEELRAWCATRGAVTVEARSYAAEGELLYGPVTAWLRADALQGRIARLDPVRMQRLASLLPELSVDAGDLASPAPLSEDEQRSRLFEAIASVLLATASPLLLVVDDLQWCDQETLRFLHFLLRAHPEARLLVAATARREEVDRDHPLNHLLAGLQALERITEAPLGRLTREETALLAGRVDRRVGERLDQERLYEETEGIPLFVVEAVRAGRGSDPATGRTLTAKARAVIESRLAQLSGPARELVDLAATIGREFTPEVLAHATGVGDDALVRALDELWRRRIIREQGAQAYDFSHDKIREVAYLALSPALRRRNHGAVADGLEQLYEDDPDAASAQIAAHWERAGRAERAIDWYQRAAEAAQKRHANREAARLLDRALDLLRALPETPGRATQELELLAALPAALWVEGYASPRLALVLRRALELTGSLGIDPAPPLLRSLAIASLTRSDFAGAQRFGQQLRERAERDADDVLLVESAYVLGIAAFWQGQFASAQGHFETAVARYRPESRRAHLVQYGLDPKVICLSRLGNTLWFLGHGGAAARARDAALALAEEIGHPFSRETALVFATILAIDMRDRDGVRSYAAMLAAGQSLEARQIHVFAEGVAGYVDLLTGRPEGIARIQHALNQTGGIEDAPGIRATLSRLLLEACALAGDEQLGLATAVEALALGEATLWDAETRRLRAEFLAALDSPWVEVERELARALQVARAQQARSLELRAAISNVCLRRRANAPGQRQALATLQTVAREMPEDDDSPDLREARSLLP